MKLLVSFFRGFAARIQRTMKVIPLTALSDNYMYLLIDEGTKSAAIVDPVDVTKILSTVESLGVKLTSALVTHHHSDHAGGTSELSREFKGALHIYGGDNRINKLTDKVGDGHNLKVGELDISCIATPCHTTGHICYYVSSKNGEKAVFTGDTLFIGGCGRFFEGTAEQMNIALNEKLGTLPPDTKVYCGHEYTVANLRFARSVEPSNAEVTKKLSWAESERKNSRETVPSTIFEEKLFNPFMRVSTSEELQKLAKSSDPVHVMAHIRRLKNEFRE